MRERTTASRQGIDLIGAATGAGGPAGGCADGPDALAAAGLAAALAAPGRDVQWTATVRTDPDFDHLRAIGALNARLAQSVSASLARGRGPIVLGGDHSCALGTWRAVANALRPRGPLGLVWIDAHLDSHTAQTSASGAVHGMPLAGLLGHGLPQLIGREPALLPQHVAVVGAASFEPEEAALLLGLGVRVFSMAEVRRRGLDTVLADALAVVRADTAGFGITIDLDAIDPRDAPGVSVPVPGGLIGAELIRGIAGIATDPALMAIEIAEFNPERDVAGKTAQLVAALLASALGATAAAGSAGTAAAFIAREQRFGAHNYAPLPVVLARGAGVYVWDVEGKRYLDMLSAYSAVSLGHSHPRIVRALCEQAERIAVTSRAFSNDQLPAFLETLCQLTGLDAALPVNTGLEAVETALKAARKWAYRVKGVPENQARIIACEGNFHGRSIAIVAMSSEPQYRDGFGPFPGALDRIPFGDAPALERAIGPHTAAFLVEPIQGEGGIIVPPAGYLAECARICREHNVLLILDEVQTGFARTGRLFACEHDGVRPDGIILGKALGGGMLPVAAFVARREVMDVFTPGDHGSTFGGNPLAAAVGRATLDVIVTERFAERTAELGDYFMAQLRAIASPLVREVRGRGLLIGVDLDPARADARALCEKLLARGILCKDTHGTVVRFAPPLIITTAQIDWVVSELRLGLHEMESERDAASCVPTA